MGSAGDFNGDGFDDVVIGDSYARPADGVPGNGNAGVTYVLYGAATMPKQISAVELTAATGTQQQS